MKKHLFIAVWLIPLCLTIFACRGKGSVNKEETNTSTAVEAIDSIKADTTSADSSRIISRKNLRKALDDIKECRICALSNNHGSLMVYDVNGLVARNGVDERLHNKLKEINHEKKEIIDVTITDGGHWIAVYDKNDWHGILPQNVLDQLKGLNSPDIEYKSVSFNDEGEYIIVTKNNFYSSSSKYRNFYRNRKAMLGELYTATIWNDGAVFCFEKGATFCGEIPESLANELRKFKNAYMVKFTDKGDYVISSKSGKVYSYLIKDIDSSYKCTMVKNELNEDDADNGSQSSNNQSTQQGQYTRTPVPVQRPQQCGICYGSGKCSQCNGSGVSTFGHIHECGGCRGSGRCPTCAGSGISGYVTEYIY